MVLIFASLFFLILFGFLGVMSLSYTIYSFEKNRVDEITKKQSYPESEDPNQSRAQYSSSINNNETFKKPKKGKLPKKINEFYQSSMVVIRDQDYKGWYQKFMFNFNKITSNIGLYTRYSISYLYKLIQKKDDHMRTRPEIEIELNKDVEKTAKKVESTNRTQVKNYSEEIVEVKEVKNQPSSQSATINMVAQEESTSREKTIYNKLEGIILQKLKTNGMDCWPIWMELAAHYEKYKEYDKATEIFAMVMKNSQGPEKNIAKDKLIALS